MYELATRQRLPILDEAGEVKDNRILLPLNWEIGKPGNW
jgi:hypothetical protein